MEPVRYDVEAAVATITLNRPDRLNAMTAEMGAAYTRALHRADEDGGVRAIVITGSGRGFCAGADLALFSGDAPEPVPDSSPFRPDLAMRLSKPVIAAVNGPAAGIGFVLMLMADIRFVAAEAVLTTSFARLGLIAEYGSAWLLTRIAGLENAMDLLLTGRKISGTEAARLGLARTALPAAEVLPAASAYAEALARDCSPRSLAVIKAQLYADLNRPFDQALDEAEALMRESFTAPDLVEGFRAQLEKRPPAFPELARPCTRPLADRR